MDTTGHSYKPARNFALRGVAWSVGLFGVMRLHAFETHVVLPLTQLQARIAVGGFGTPALPIQITLACSGADALALCAAAILAYPATWRSRLEGAAGGIALVLTLNTIRIGTLGSAAASPSRFEALHLYVWPALLTLAIAGYVFTWMRLADRRRHSAQRISPSASPSASSHDAFAPWRFVSMALVFLVLFTAASPLYLENAGVLAVAAFIARAAASALRALGIPAAASANLLSTARGGLLVTQECISTPLIPLYFAAVLALAIGWQRRVLAAAAALPLFVALGILRLLVVAVPAAVVDSPLFLIHAFYQLVLAGVVVAIAAVWRHGAGQTAWFRALEGATLGVAFIYFVGPLYTRLLTSVFVASPVFDDPQGAIAFLPSFQIGLYIALSIAALVAFDARSWTAGLAVLGLLHLSAFAALDLISRHAWLMPHVRDVRAWALAGPVLVVLVMVTRGQPRR